MNKIAAKDGSNIQYFHYPPRKLPEGKIFLHNPVWPQRRRGLNGSRIFITDKREGFVVCECGWAPSLVHYRDKDNLPARLRSKEEHKREEAREAGDWENLT